MAVFTIVPDKGFTKQTTPKVLTTQFGDGYAHRVADGINSINTSWDVTFNSRSLVHSDEIIAFFELHAGVVSFDFTPPDEVTVYRVYCPDWRQIYESPISRSTSAKFVRTYQ